jgi:hypothetical protein
MQSHCLWIFSHIFSFQVDCTSFVNNFILIIKSQINCLFIKWKSRYTIPVMLNFGPSSWGSLNLDFVDKMTFKNTRTTLFSRPIESRSMFSGSKKFILGYLRWRAWPLSYEETPPPPQKKILVVEVNIPCSIHIPAKVKESKRGFYTKKEAWSQLMQPRSLDLHEDPGPLATDCVLKSCF